MAEVIIQVILGAILTCAYFLVCSSRETTLLGKVAEVSSMYGISILAFFDKIKIWTLILGFVVIGVIKILTSKKAKSERKHTGVDI